MRTRQSRILVRGIIAPPRPIAKRAGWAKFGRSLLPVGLRNDLLPFIYHLATGGFGRANLEAISFYHGCSLSEKFLTAHRRKLSVRTLHLTTCPGSICGDAEITLVVFHRQARCGVVFSIETEGAIVDHGEVKGYPPRVNAERWFESESFDEAIPLVLFLWAKIFRELFKSCRLCDQELVNYGVPERILDEVVREAYYACEADDPPDDFPLDEFIRECVQRADEYMPLSYSGSEGAGGGVKIG